MFLNKNNNRGGIITMQSKQLPYHQTTMGSIPSNRKMKRAQTEEKVQNLERDQK